MCVPDGTSKYFPDPGLEGERSGQGLQTTFRFDGENKHLNCLILPCLCGWNKTDNTQERTFKQWYTDVLQTWLISGRHRCSLSGRSDTTCLVVAVACDVGCGRGGSRSVWCVCELLATGSPDLMVTAAETKFDF